jgi:MFS family permease
LRKRLPLPDVLREQGLLPLILSSTLAEVAGNMVYVALLERAYQLGGETASVGGVMLVQSAPQVLLGIWAGNLVDRLGKRKAATLATLAKAALVVGLACWPAWC